MIIYESLTFLTRVGMKYMKSYWLNDGDLKEFCAVLPNFQLAQFHKWMKVDDRNISYQNELIFLSIHLLRIIWPSWISCSGFSLYVAKN